MPLAERGALSVYSRVFVVAVLMTIFVGVLAACRLESADLCTPEDWTAPALAEVQSLVPAGAIDVEVGALANDCPRPSQPFAWFLLDAPAGGVRSAVRGQALVHGWIPVGQRCELRKVIAGQLSYFLVEDGGEENAWQILLGVDDEAGNSVLPYNPQCQASTQPDGYSGSM